MINKDETYVIDPEFAFVGPFGFDIGALLANMISIYVSHFFRGKESGYQEWLLVTIREILEMFDEKFFDLWDETKNSALTIDDFINDSSYEEYKSWFLKNILRDSVGFAGCKMARRVYGVAGVEEIRGIEDKSLRAKAEALILRVAKSFVKNYESVDCVDDVLNLIEEECK
jgi:5-methylthioribose kinase